MGGTPARPALMLGTLTSHDCMQRPIYRTTDLHLASFLLHCGTVLAGCRRLRPKKNEFQFLADARLHQLLRLYWSATPTRIVPSRLLGTLTFLKRRALAEPLPERSVCLSSSSLLHP